MNDNTNRDAVLVNDNANRDTVLGNANANRDTILVNANTNRDAVLSNSNTNRDLVLDNANANHDEVLADASSNKNAILDSNDAMRDAILANDDANRDAIIANDNDNRDLIVDLNLMIADDVLRREIQNNLGSDQCTPWMYTREFLDPEQTVYLGGQLEIVLEVIQTVIDQAGLLGTVATRDLNRALDDLDQASLLEPSEAQEICRLLLRAYKWATVTGGA